MQLEEEINYGFCFANRLIPYLGFHFSICVVLKDENQFHFCFVVFWFQFAIRVENWLRRNFPPSLRKKTFYLHKQKKKTKKKSLGIFFFFQ